MATTYRVVQRKAEVMTDHTNAGHDFIVVGSGAGGGPLAANLVEAGFSVLLLEAGSDHTCPYYDVPIMQALASEDDEMSWEYFVRHYADDEQQQRDSKFVPEEDGVLYPRGGTLGGSTAVSAMITLYPSDSDWQYLADLTGDPDWGPAPMRQRFTRVQAWRGPDPDPAQPARPGDANDLGFEGWLPVSRADPTIASREPWFLEIINAIEAEVRQRFAIPDEVMLPFDPNSAPFVSNREQGMVFVPVAVGNGERRGARERILDAQRAHPDLLDVRTDALVTKVIIEDGRAVGVEYLDGARLYEADPRKNTATGPGTPKRASARKEIILSGGAYNSPQLLLLSGIGPREQLESFDIPVEFDSPGVGKNLQDRYEVCVVEQLVDDYTVFGGQVLQAPDRDGVMNSLYAEWFEDRGGPYSTNGSLAALIATSTVAASDPDLYVMALPIDFHGYYPGYSRDSATKLDRLTLLVLKGHTNNHGGTVTLTSADPRRRPRINFRYFDEGTDTDGDDLRAVQDGVAIARSIASRLSTIIDHELVPGAQIQGEAVGEWVKDNAWGHHAACSAKIGADDDPDAVLDGDFRVRGIDGLRVVDASVFPKIPGLFICAAVYMISERASDVIIAEHQATHAAP